MSISVNVLQVCEKKNKTSKEFKGAKFFDMAEQK